MADTMILIVEDDAGIHQMLKELLTMHQYECWSAYSGTEAVLMMERQRFDLVLLDLMLPGMSGREVIGQVPHGLPVICLTAMASIDDKVELLSAGAVDYITKPFDNRELLARIGAQLRRTSSAPASPTLRHKNIEMDTENFSVCVQSHPVALTRREFLILKLLMDNPKKVFSKANLYESVWGDDYIGDDNTVTVHISNLRQKLQKAGSGDCIQTVWGIGFKLKD